MTRLIPTVLIPVLALTVAGCGESSPSADAGAGESAWLMASMPGDALSVVDAKSSASEGDRVVVRGFIGGQMEAISSESPVFQIVDTGLHNPCVTEVDDNCPTPWDYCCTARETILAHSATVQLVDASGAVLDVDPIAAGLNPLDEVIIVGTVGARPTTEVLTVRATGVYRVAAGEHDG